MLTQGVNVQYSLFSSDNMPSTLQSNNNGALYIAHKYINPHVLNGLLGGLMKQ